MSTFFVQDQYYALPDEGKTIDESTLIHSVYNYRKIKYPRFTKRYEREQLLAIDMLRLETETKQCSAEGD